MRLYLLLLLLDKAFGWQAFLSPEQMKKAGIFPWIGILKVRLGNTEYATGLTLIAERLAAANSNDISKLDKNTLRISTKAIFFKHNVPWYCDVTDYKIHPEFNNITSLNTLAILFLDCDRTNWTSIRWPIEKKPWKNMFAIGLSDQNYDFEQKMYRMKLVSPSKCWKFYVKEEIDYKNLWPKHFLCFKAVDIKHQCVFDTGMALASLNNGRWTLIGIGTLGPGCVLPSRFIDIFPYVSWMNEQKNKHRLNYRRQMADGEENNDDNSASTAIDASKDIVSDSTFLNDDFYIEKIDSSTMALRPNYDYMKEKVHGPCKENDGVKMYREAGIIRTSKRTATGLYALSLYDLFFYKITCVMVSVVCDKRSPTEFWFDSGFQTDHYEDLIKVVPQYKMGQTVPPKILYLTDTYHKYENIKTANLMFKFEFTAQATINIDFWGLLVTTTQSYTTSTATTRTRGGYHYHLYHTLGWLPGKPDDNPMGPGPFVRKKKYRTKKRFIKRAGLVLE